MSARVGVVGHAEWVDFCVVDRVPAAGEVVHGRDWFAGPGGGGAVAAVQLRKLAGAAMLLTALGDDALGERLRTELSERHGVAVHATRVERPQRRGFVHVDGRGERTITMLGERMVPCAGDRLPWDELATLDGVYLTAGDPAAVRAARAARVLVATARAGEALGRAGVELDVLVASAADERERDAAQRLASHARHVVLTDGARGGTWTERGGAAGAWAAVEPPSPPVDAYGCGDSFAAGLTWGLAAGLTLDAALEIGARCGAHCIAGHGPFAGQLTHVPQPVLSARRSAS